MKRKVNQVGTGTLTVSLPNKWAEKNKIKKGDELDVEEENNNLILSSDYKLKISSCKIDVSGQKSMVHRIIGATYKAGYDEVIVNYSSNEEYERIQYVLDKTLPEFDIVEFKPNQIRLKSITKLEQEYIETVFNKAFFSLKGMAEDTLKAIKNEDINEFKNIILRDKLVDKYTDYCRRLLNKGCFLKFKRPYPVYSILETVEIIGDLYKDICQIFIKSKQKISKNILELFHEINLFLYEFIGCIVNFDFQKIKRIGEERIILNKKIETITKIIKPGDLSLFIILIQIFNNTFEMKSALLTENV